MPRELWIVWAGRRQKDDWERLCGGYRRRIGGPWRVRDVPVRARGAGADVAGRRREEAKALRSALPEPVWTVALDSGGRARTSMELARWLERLLERWPHPVAFLIGSDLGLPASLRKGANETLSLGPLTLPHQLARLVLYEQIFRAASIRAGINYHRA